MSNFSDSARDMIPEAKRARLQVGEGTSGCEPAAASSASSVAVMNGGHPIRKTFSRGAVVKLRLENFL